MSILVEHARFELERVGEEPETIDWYVKVIEAFCELGHSGGSAAVTIPVLNDLLQFKNLTALTWDPAEWNHIAEELWGGVGGVWQSRRNPEAFSNDAGKHYYLLSEVKQGGDLLYHKSGFPFHNKEIMDFAREQRRAELEDDLRRDQEKR